MSNLNQLLTTLRNLHDPMRDAIVAACEAQSTAALAQVAYESADDTIYHIDRISEQQLIDFLRRELTDPVMLIAEGLPDGMLMIPSDCPPEQATWRIIVDPIDGTRGLMYQKRSAWILTGVAPNLGPTTCLADIVLAVQTEIPLVKQHLCDTVWAIRGEGAHGERLNRLTGERTPLKLHPSQATTIEHGFITVSRFFPGARVELSAIDEAWISAVLGPPPPERATCFEDQYICCGGQLYELMVGHDRVVADIRPLLTHPLLCSHPYDLCTELIARECGIQLTDPFGQPLTAPLDVSTNVAWVGYANRTLQAQLQPHLQRLLA